jgi:DNA-binding NarL/FixJ family response regulator
MEQAGTSASRTAVILDRYPLWLSAVARVLNAVEVEVVGSTTVSEDALMLVEETQPDLLVCDPAAANGDSTVATYFERVAQRSARTKIVALAASRAPVDIDAALEAGAVAYVIKSADPVDLASVIRQSFQKSLFLTTANYVPRAVATNGKNGKPPADSGLTPREREILSLVAEGYSNAQLARMLWVTEQTVKFHLSNIYRKLAVTNRTEASRWAQVHGLVSTVAQEA